MQAKLPVLAVTDKNTDIGKVIVEGGFGWWYESNVAYQLHKATNEICRLKLSNLCNNSWIYLNNNYAVNNAYKIIMKHFEN